MQGHASVRTKVSVAGIFVAATCGGGCGDADSPGAETDATSSTGASVSATSTGGSESQTGVGTVSTDAQTTGTDAMPPGWSSVAVGGIHACGTGTDGTLWCWGENDRGQLGVTTVSLGATPVRVGLRSDWERVWSSVFFSCARASDGLWCWGQNDVGQLGNGTMTESEMEPVKALVPEDFVSVALGQLFGCALLADGSVRCWGEGSAGQLGDGDTMASSEPVNVALQEQALALHAGAIHACVDVAGGIHCWGSGPEGQLGTGTMDPQPMPVEAFANVGADRIVLATFQRSCARTPGGQTYCAGRNDHAQLGNGVASMEPVVEPQAVPALDELQQFAGGISHSCGLAEDGSLLCWGGNAEGQVGNGSTAPALQPIEIGDGDWTFVPAGSFNTCAIDTEDRLWCWGANESGQTGAGKFDSPITTPTEVVEGML